MAQLLFGELVLYSIPSWLVFIAIAYCSARYGGRRFVIPGHIAVALLIVFLDVHWIQGEMHKPGWNGQPDQDVVFMFGVVFRIFLVNTILLPVTALGVWLMDRRTSIQSKAQTETENTGSE